VKVEVDLPTKSPIASVSTRPMPGFKAIQTSSDRTVVNWIEPTVKGAPEPEHPAPP
jgi:hypothetical protein